MKLQVVAIKDEKSEAYGTPNFVTAVGVAVRGFSDEINRPADDNVLYRHPDDFVLYHLGEYDDKYALFEQLGIPEVLCRGSALKKEA